MNPTWKRSQRRAYARKCLAACTGTAEPRKALRIAYSVAWRILAGVACLIGGFYVGTGVSVAWHASETACVTEDSTYCHWDGDAQGNGQGRSFTTYWEGFTVYEH